MMGVIRGNSALGRIYERTRSLLPKIIAHQRWVEQGINQHDFARREVRLSPHGYTSMEKDLEGRQPQFHTYHRLFQYWTREGIPFGVREQCLDLLTMPGIFEQKNPAKNEEYGPQPTLLQVIEATRNGAGVVLTHEHMSAYYHRIGFDVGHPNVTKKFPTFWSMLHTRDDIGTVPEAVEVVDIVETMYAGKKKEQEQMRALRRAEITGLWREVKAHQYRGWGLEEPLVRFLTAVELNLAGTSVSGERRSSVTPVTLTSQSLQERYGITELPAQRILQNELIPWEEVEPVASCVLSPEELPEFKKAWIACVACEANRDSFPRLVQAAMQDRGFTYKHISDLLGLKIDDEKRKKGDDERSTRDRPESQLRSIINYNRGSSQIAVESILRVLARDESHYCELRTAYETERERYYRRGGSSLKGDGLKMRILRELGNVPMRQLALHFLPKKQHEATAVVRAKNLELQRLERNEGKKHRITFRRVFSILEAEIKKQAEVTAAALAKENKFPEALSAFSSVSQMAGNCIQGMKGAAYVSDAMRDIARTDDEWLRSDVVQDVADGKFIPPLPPLRIMSKGVAGTVLAPEVVADWYGRFPEQLRAGSEFSGFTFERPLPLCLATMIGSMESNMIHFFETRTMHWRLRPTHGSAFVHALDERDLEPDDWQFVRHIMLGTNRDMQDIDWQFAKALFDNGQDVPAAVETIRSLLKQSKLLLHPQYLPGTTPKQLRKFS